MGYTGGSILPRSYNSGLYVSDGGIMFNTINTTTIANSVTETSGINSTGAFGTLTIPANFLQIGSLIIVRASGSLQTDVALPTLAVKSRFAGTTLSDSGATSMLAQIVTPKLFEYTCTISTTSIGASGSVRVAQIMWLNDLSNPSLGIAPAPATINTTVASAIDVRFTWGTANTNNSLIVNNVAIEVWR